MDFIDLATQQKKIKEKLDSNIQTVLSHGKYIMGPEIKQLEERLAEYVGVKHCITVSDGSKALLIAMMALGIKVGDEVIFKYNQVVGNICFDSMCSMIAKVHSLRYGAQFPWLKDPQDPARHGCPDGANVIFELSKLSED